MIPLNKYRFRRTSKYNDKNVSAKLQLDLILILAKNNIHTRR